MQVDPAAREEPTTTKTTESSAGQSFTRVHRDPGHHQLSDERGGDPSFSETAQTTIKAIFKINK
jgi:hypothetical protein